MTSPLNYYKTGKPNGVDFKLPSVLLVLLLYHKGVSADKAKPQHFISATAVCATVPGSSPINSYMFLFLFKFTSTLRRQQILRL